MSIEMRVAVSTVVICALLLAVAAHREWGSWESQERAVRSYGHFSQDELWDTGKETNDIGSNGKLAIGGMEWETNRVEDNNDLEIMMETYNATNTTTVSGPTTSKPESGPTTSKPESEPTTSKPESGPTTSKPESGPTTSKPESGPTTSKPGSTQTAVMPGPEQTALSTSKVIIMTTLSTTATTTTPTTTTTTTQPTTTKNPFVTSKECQNGGTIDGIKCICTNNYYGPSCEFAFDRVEVGNTVNATVQVNMKITNKEFEPNMEDNSSPAFKEFEKDFKAQMKSIYSNVSNYKDVIIRSLSAGSIVVDYDIIFEMKYNLEVNVMESYAEIVKIVEEELLSSNCFNENSFCFQNLKITEVPVPTEDELCMASIEPGYRDFYTAIITPHGVFCVSHCNKESKEYHNCNSGDCKLEKTGPECLCPDTETYLYTTSRCTGRILKAGLYGGVGAGIAVLAIIILTLGILLCKAKQPRKRDPFSKDQGLNKPGSEPRDNDTYENIMDTY